MHVKITRAVNPASLTNNITAQMTRVDDEKEMESRRYRRARTRTMERSTKTDRKGKTIQAMDNEQM